MANFAIENQQKRTVHVDRKQLLTTLIENREKHIEDYKAAVDGYRELAKEKLKVAHEKAKSKLDENLRSGIATLDEFDPSNPRKSDDYLTLVEGVRVELKVPRNFSAEYDAAIDMATWDTRPIFELTHAEFQCFVRDIWDWSYDFAFTNMVYKKKQ